MQYRTWAPYTDTGTAMDMDIVMATVDITQMKIHHHGGNGG